ncbi:hypothetical protein CEXT_762981 [Caerostris extrusa]|uniref:Uncharacterized protein n=1 Tax=Caerostris extrusa TaxID=172846 RepID=A0AAV4PIK7_CAEEX|nr:hypothetical protein CEXT_762981 [Caerostris extrusa]
MSGIPSEHEGSKEDGVGRMDVQKPQNLILGEKYAAISLLFTYGKSQQLISRKIPAKTQSRRREQRIANAFGMRMSSRADRTVPFALHASTINYGDIIDLRLCPLLIFGDGHWMGFNLIFASSGSETWLLIVFESN